MTRSAGRASPRNRPMTFDEEMQDLVDRGLIEVYLDGEGERRVRLTERGHAVAMAQKAEKERNGRNKDKPAT